MKNYERLKGLITATFTPLDQNGNLNVTVIEKYADRIAESCATGIFVGGTTGESFSLTVTERKDLLKAWKKAARGRFKIIAHVGSNCLPDAIDLAAHAAELKVDAIAAISPTFFKPATVQELVNFFVPVAASAKELPFYYYNMPAMTGVNLPVDAFLAEGKKVIPNLVGVKFTHNNLMEMGECMNLQNGDFEVLHGYDEILIAGLAFGATSAIGSTYNYIPGIYGKIMDAVKNNDWNTARIYQMKSIEIVKIIIKYGGGVRGGKAIMNLIGIECGECRLPIPPFSEEEYKQLSEDLSNTGFFEYIKIK